MNLWRTCALAGLVLVLAATLQSQTYSVVYNFGVSATDAVSPQNTGIIAQGRDGNLYTTTPFGGANGVGTMVRITASGEASVLYSFGTADPNQEYPYSGLTLGTDGNFYGATSAIASGSGTIFRITPQGQITFLHTFSGSDGHLPFSPPIQASDGSFYGTTTEGGNSGFGTVYKLTLDGQFKTLYSFDSAHGTFPKAPLVEGVDGNLYGTTWEGGQGGVGTVYRITTKGKITTLHDLNWTDGAYPVASLLQGLDGNFYGVADEGGANGLGGIYRITPKKKYTLLHSFAVSDGEFSSAGMVLGTDGNFYGGTFGSTNSGTVYRMTPAGSFSVIHSFDNQDGAHADVTVMQHTTGLLYGDTINGGSNAHGVFYKIDGSFKPFVAPLPGLGKVGDSVGVLGQGFTGATAVSFSGTSAPFAVISNTFLSVTVPDGAKTGAVTVTMAGGNLESKQDFRVTPVIKSFSPSSGPVGSAVVISGVSLAQAIEVDFGSKPASFTVNSDKQITAIVSAGAQSGKITVTTAGGSATSSKVFTVTP